MTGGEGGGGGAETIRWEYLMVLPRSITKTAIILLL